MTAYVEKYSPVPWCPFVLRHQPAVDVEFSATTKSCVDFGAVPKIGVRQNRGNRGKGQPVYKCESRTEIRR